VNIGIGKFMRNGLTLESVESAFRRFAAAVTGGFLIQHKEDGTHTAVTCNTLTIAAPDQEGNVTASLVPTTATQDLGSELTLSSAVVRVRPWRKLYLSSNIVFEDYGDGIAIGNPGIVRSGRSLSIGCGAAGANGSPSLTGWFGGLTSTLTVGGGGTTSTGTLVATTSAHAGTFVQAPQLRLTDGVTAPGAQTGLAVIYVDAADGDLKVVFSDGTVKTIVTD
jgi:hypothetical protein